MGWEQLQQITKSTDFGTRSSIDGNYAIVGDDGSNSAHWFQRKDDGSWEEVHSVTKSGDFGGSVAISGNYAIVGATSNDTVYWYQRKDDGSWEEVHSVTKSGAFGDSIAISGNYVIVGDYNDDSYRGKVYWYQRKGNGSWVEIQTAVGQAPGDQFGWDVDISGNYAIIAAVNTNATTPTKIYWYQRNREGNWERLHRDTKLSSDTAYQLVPSVAISGNYSIVGLQQSNGANGVVYWYHRKGDGNWKEIQNIPGTGGATDFFGYSVDISGNYAIVGAYGSATAYWYQRQNDGVWREFNQVTESGSYGYSVGISGNYAIVGDLATGAAYLYQRNKN